MVLHAYFSGPMNLYSLCPLAWILQEGWKVTSLLAYSLVVRAFSQETGNKYLNLQVISPLNQVAHILEKNSNH